MSELFLIQNPAKANNFKILATVSPCQIVFSILVHIRLQAHKCASGWSKSAAVITRMQRTDGRAQGSQYWMHWQYVRYSYLTDVHSQCWYLVWHSSFLHCLAWETGGFCCKFKLEVSDARACYSPGTSVGCCCLLWATVPQAVPVGSHWQRLRLDLASADIRYSINIDYNILYALPLKSLPCLPAMPWVY